jgi:glycosyltransferase 2 family protein
LLLATYYGRALRWAIFLKPLKAKPSIANILSATVIGFSAVTLFGRPGEFVRPYLIAMKEGVPVASQIAAWVLERIFDLLMALLVFGFALNHLAATGLHGGSRLAWVFATGGRAVAVCAVAILVSLVFLRHFAESFEQFVLARLRFLPAARQKKVAHLTGSLVRGVESARSDSALVSILLYSILEWALIAACYWCLVQAYSGVFSITFVDVLVLMGFVSFGAVVQIPGIGGGVQVVAVLVLTELFGIRVELATSFAMFVWIMTFVIIVPIGLVLALKQGLDWRSLRRIGREAAV